MGESDITLEAVRAARDRIAPYVLRTPVVSSSTLEAQLGRRITIKLELLQETGSFKPRGALNQAFAIPENQRSVGMVGVSGGNFAQGLAYAGRVLGIPTTVVMPSGTPDNYVAAARAHGATVDLVDGMSNAFHRVDELAAGGMAKTHPFDDPAMIAGNGSVGLEICEEVGDPTDVIISIGGGGFMAGVATAIKEQHPGVRIWGVETEGADAMRRALDAGGVVEITPTSVAKTLNAPWVSETTLAAARRYLEDVVVVTDRQAVQAIRRYQSAAHIVPEPAAACTLPAAERLADRLGEHVVLVVCGGNVAIEDILGWEADLGIA